MNGPEIVLPGSGGVPKLTYLILFIVVHNPPKQSSPVKMHWLISPVILEASRLGKAV